jgi:hypothetical protein
MATVIKSPTNFEYSKDVIAAPSISGNLTITVPGALATVNGKIANYLYLPAGSLIRKPKANWQYRTLTQDELKQLGEFLKDTFSDRVIVINVPVRGLATDIAKAKDAQTPFEFKLFVFFNSNTPPTNKQVLNRVRATYQALNRPVLRRVSRGTFEYIDALVNEKFAMDIAGVNTAKLVNMDAAFAVGYEVSQADMMLQQYSANAGWNPKQGDTVIIELISAPRNSLVKPRRMAVQAPVKVTLSDTSLAAAQARLFGSV